MRLTCVEAFWFENPGSFRHPRVYTWLIHFSGEEVGSGNWEARMGKKKKKEADDNSERQRPCVYSSARACQRQPAPSEGQEAIPVSAGGNEWHL